jgi:formate hydrogenlyase subunit 3/multisubunit Na+/H+ antiporter MnhD subunit
MLSELFHPLTIFLIGLGGGFAIPVLYRLGKGWLNAGFVLALGAILVVSLVAFYGVVEDGQPFEIITAGAQPPYSINLRFGAWEGACVVAVNIVAVLGAIHMRGLLLGRYVPQLLYLVMTIGIAGLIMTRDLFNLFVFLEIVSIATYGLLGLGTDQRSIAASFKYIIATVLASSYFLIGSTLVYYSAGTLNLDELFAGGPGLETVVGQTALLLLLACLLIELKPFPANGWGLDTYETAPSGIAAMMSVGVSAGVFFALFKLLPLFEDQFFLIALSGGITFLFSNLLGLAQGKVQRLLGYSSVGQMGLLVLAVVLLRDIGAQASVPLVAAGLFLNHLLAKAGLFWFAGVVGAVDVDRPPRTPPGTLALGALAIFVIAIAGLPPFPGFWAKFELVMQLVRADRMGWVVLILLGSLLEAAYLFRWFARLLRAEHPEATVGQSALDLVPLVGAALLLVVGGVGAASWSGVDQVWIFVPLMVGAAGYAIDGLPTRIKGVATMAAVLVVGFWLAEETAGIARLFAHLLLAGGFVVGLGSLYRTDPRPGYYPLLALLLLSIVTLLRSSTSLQFLYSWEIITLSSYFLIAQGRGSEPHLLQFLLFSLASAFLLLVGFAEVAALAGTTDLAYLAANGPPAAAALVLLAAGFLIKTAAVGFHVWLVGAYAEADDDFTAMLSAVVSKVGIAGLFIGTYLAIRSEAGLDIAEVLAWIGMLTTIAGALLALVQTDFKRLLAFSSMSQLGYIITAIALMSHLGWVTALYLVANHMMVKGILFLAIAAIILRTGTRNFAEAGGLRRDMPLTFALVVFALVAMSGLPPLMGFGGKWLLLSAMTDKGWYLLVIAGLFATFLGFLYMGRLAGALFLGERKPAGREISEAPVILLIPQAILAAGIVVLSFFPKLLIDPVSKAIDPQFAATLVWEGMSLETIYGYWNPIPAALIATAVAAALFGASWYAYRHYRSGRDARSYLAFYRPLIARATPPIAEAFWRGVDRFFAGSAGFLRAIYTGNGQTYALHVMLYFLAIYFLSEVARGFGS